MNGRVGRADYVPVHYVKRRLGEDEVKALYVAADVALIASVREGVNLWAMEYVACMSRRPERASLASSVVEATRHGELRRVDRVEPHAVEATLGPRRPSCEAGRLASWCSRLLGICRVCFFL